ncbi:MAG: hypothetical protein KAS32_02915, partial [Candidatus Peribacteraceae bacterium]|nr:hypothetical protein [Candidatus Peribacteraceae bacterium]
MNIATVVNHAQIENEKWIADPENYNGQVLRLLTNTRCLLEMPIETYNHEVIASIGKSPKTTLKGIGHSLAVRSVYEAGFATCMLECCQDDVTGCRRMSGKQLEKARLFEIAVEKIDEYERDYGKTRQPDISDTRRIINNILPNYAQDFIKDRWYNTVKRLSVADAQELESKQCLTKTQDSWWVDPEGLMPTVFEANLEEYSRSDLTKLDYSYTSNEPSGILAILGISEREIEMPGESPPKRWCVQNVYQTPAKEILTLDKFDETFYATWPCGISETKTIILINKLFGLHGIIRDYKGVIELVYSEGEFIVELCSLPLKKPLSLSEYRRLLCKSREENKDLPGDKQVPSEILCDTTTCSLKIELLILGEDAGIMFAFKSPELIGPLMEAFIHTSSWAHGWEFASTLVDIVREGIEAKTVEWR